MLSPVPSTVGLHYVLLPALLSAPATWLQHGSTLLVWWSTYPWQHFCCWWFQPNNLNPTRAGKKPTSQVPKFSDYHKWLRTALSSKYIGCSSKGLLLILVHLNPPEFQVWQFLFEKLYMLVFSGKFKLPDFSAGERKTCPLPAVFSCCVYHLCRSSTSISCRIRILWCYCTLLLRIKIKI